MLIVISAPVAGAEYVSETTRFRTVWSWLQHPVDWVTTNGDRTAFGSGSLLTVMRAGPDIERQFVPPFSVRDGVLAGNDLYVIDDARRLHKLGLNGESNTFHAVPTAEQPGTIPHLALMDDYLIIAEDYVGITLLALPTGHDGHGAGTSMHSDALKAVASLPVAFRIAAVATAARKIYLAEEGAGIHVIEARDPHAPEWIRSLPADGPVTAMTVNGDRLYLVDESGIRVLNRIGEVRPAVSDHSAGLGGTAIAGSGRTLLVGSGDGLSSLRDQSITEAIHDVSVANTFFSPSSLIVAPGDTVRWTNTGGIHNTESCDGIDDSPSCAGIATEQWRNGPPAGTGWTFEQLFTIVGTNPYFCFQHRFFGMDGTIIVQQAAVAPPGVGDGRPGNGIPMTVAKGDAAGSSLDISWDTGLCVDAVEFQILYGGGSTLPGVPGGTYALLGSQCGIGTISPFTWSPAPSTVLDPGGLIWWIVTATNGVSEEGSFGKDSALGERAGPGAAGSSMECGNSGKDLTNACGQP